MNELSENKLHELNKSIEAHGFWNTEALIIFEVQEEGKPIYYLIAEGNHRVWVCKQRGMTHLEFLIITLPLGMISWAN